MEVQENDAVITHAGGLAASTRISTEGPLDEEPKRSTDSRSSHGGGSQPPETLAALIRKASSSTASGRSLPALVEPGDADFLASSFDPVNLLEVGLREWRDRTLSLQCLKRSRTVAPSSNFLGLSSRSSYQISNYKELNRSWGEPFETLQGEAFRQPGENRTDRPSDVLQNEAGTKPSIGAFQEIQSFRRNTSIPMESGIPSDLIEYYYSSLANAPHASLIHLVILYHQTLCNHGLVEEAEQIARLLEGLEDEKQEEIDVDLQGMDLLLKDGLLGLYLRIQPYVPPVRSQIVKFKSLTYSRDTSVNDDSYDTVLTKAVDCLQGPLRKGKVPQKVVILKDVAGYLMPGSLTLILGPPACGKSSLHQVLSGQLPAGASFEGMLTYNDEDIHDVRIHQLASMIGHSDIHLPLLTVRETLEFARDCILAFRPRHFGPELKEIMGDALRIGQDPKLEINLSMMGLKHVANRLVGNALIPSITEDERHRLTAAEMFAGVHAVYFFDQLNTVVEDAITYDLLASIRIFTRVRQITVMVTLLNPSSEVFNLFDRLIVLDQGHIVYQGPRQDALPYFENLGYKKPKHLSVGEFLQEVTTSDGIAFLQPGLKKLDLEDFVSSYKRSDMYKDVCRIVDSPQLLQEIWVQGNQPLGLKFLENKQFDEIGLEESSFYLVSGVSADNNGSLVTVSMDHTASVQTGDKVVAVGGSTGTLHYLNSKTYKNSFERILGGGLGRDFEPVRLQLERPFKRVRHVLAKQFSSEYVLGFKSEVLLLIDREIKSTWRNRFSLYVRLFQVLILSLFVSFLLFRVKSDPDQRNMNLFRTAFFVSLLNMTTFNLVQLPILMEERDVYYKQHGAHFFRPASYLLGKIFGSFPFSLCEATIWTFIVYFVTGMSVADGGWHFFIYYIIIILAVLNGASMVRFFSFFSPDRDKAAMFIGLFIAVFILFAGFLVPHFVVPKYWIWMYYINPLQWAITALVINEYNSGSYSQLCKNVPELTAIPQCAGRPNDTVGHAYLEVGQFYTSRHWFAVSIAVLCGWVMLWNILTYFALSKMRHAAPLRLGSLIKAQTKISLEDLQREEEEMEDATQKLSHTAFPITLSWHELSYDVMIPSIGKTRTILSYVSGWGEPGDMVAIFGSGGSGKTSLLNCLAGRKVSMSHIGGQILVNSYPKVQNDFGNVMGYVDKIDAYAPYITVRETVSYAAAMHLGKMSSKQEQLKFVEEVLELTELKQIQDTLVISLANDITVDQEKRLAIATELVTNPSILFLDDPAKGVDSSSAIRIVKCVQQIARTGRLVIATLKYPSQRLLSTFTKVQILKSGETVYFGPVGKDGEMIRKYFEAIPGTPLCPPNKSIYSFAIDIISDRVTYKKAVKDYAFEYRVSELALRNHVHLQHLRRSKGQNGPEIPTDRYGEKFASRLLETILVFQRQYWRNVNYSWGRMLSYLIMSLLLGSVFYKVNYHKNAGMNARAGAILISCVLVGLTNAQNVIPQVARMRAVLQRQRAVQQSTVFFYTISWSLAEIPYLMVTNLIFCSIFLPMVNMAVTSASQFFRYWFISFEFYLVVTFLGMLLAIVSPKPQIASALIPVIIGIWVSTGGFVVPKSKILPQFIWIFWTNPLQYCLDGLTSVSFYCDVNKPECLNNGRNPGCAQDQSQCPLCNCARLTDAQNVFVWTQIKSNRSLDYDRVPYDILALAIYALLLRFCSFLAGKYLKHNKR